MRLAWIGDGNNVCHSLMLLGALLGTSMVGGVPARATSPTRRVQATVRARSAASCTVTHDPREAADGADVIYTDVWMSMGRRPSASSASRPSAATRSTRR